MRASDIQGKAWEAGSETVPKFWNKLPREVVESQSLQNPALVNAALGERMEVVDYMISKVLSSPPAITLYSKTLKISTIPQFIWMFTVLTGKICSVISSMKPQTAICSLCLSYSLALSAGVELHRTAWVWRDLRRSSSKPSATGRVANH